MSGTRKTFMDHTFQTGFKCDYTLYKHNKQIKDMPTVHRNFKKFNVVSNENGKLVNMRILSLPSFDLIGAF